MQHRFSPVITRLITFFTIVLVAVPVLITCFMPVVDFCLFFGGMTAQVITLAMTISRPDAVPPIRTRPRDDRTLRDSTGLWDIHARRALIGDLT